MDIEAISIAGARIAIGVWMRERTFSDGHEYMFVNASAYVASSSRKIMYVYMPNGHLNLNTKS